MTLDLIDYHTNLHIIKIYTNIIIEWLWADNLLYEYFKKKFLSQRKVFGLQKLKHEHQILEQASNKVKDRCIEAQVENKYLAKNDRLYGHDVMGYKVRQNSGKDCPYYTMTVFVKKTILSIMLDRFNERKALQKYRNTW